MICRNEIAYGPLPAHTLDLYLPEGGAEALLVYFHGGGIEGGDKAEIDEMPRRLTDQGLALASVNYRMYPDARFPDFLEDAALAVAWLRRESSCPRLFIGGSSAGAYLSMMLFADPRFLAVHGMSPLEVDGYVFDAGQPTTHFNVLRERGQDPRLVRVDEAAPLYFIDQDYPADRPLPRLMILTADNDMVNRLEQNRLFVRTLTHFGYPEDRITFTLMENATHCQYSCGEDFCRMVARFMA